MHFSTTLRQLLDQKLKGDKQDIYAKLQAGGCCYLDEKGQKAVMMLCNLSLGQLRSFQLSPVQQKDVLRAMLSLLEDQIRMTGMERGFVSSAAAFSITADIALAVCTLGVSLLAPLGTLSAAGLSGKVAMSGLMLDTLKKTKALRELDLKELAEEEHEPGSSRSSTDADDSHPLLSHENQRREGHAKDE